MLLQRLTVYITVSHAVLHLTHRKPVKQAGLRLLTTGCTGKVNKLPKDGNLPKSMQETNGRLGNIIRTL